MPKLKILSDQTEFEVDAGESLAEICDAQGVAIPFGCRAGACGTCRVIVRENPQNLSEMEDHEKDFLEDFFPGKNDGVRLACQCTVKGDVTLEIYPQ